MTIPPSDSRSAPVPEPFLDSDKALACIHCGLCLGSCPTYLETGNENESPRGRIYLMRALQEGRLPLGETAVRHVDLCLGCRACEAVCPSGVQYGALLEATRDHVEKGFRRNPWQTFLRRMVIERIFPFPERLEVALWPARIANGLKLERLLPRFVRDVLALVPRQISRTDLPIVSPATNQPARARVGFISGCVMSVMFGETNAASVRLLNRIGCDVVTPAGQGCCGALYAHGGNLESARACARRNIDVFDRLDLDAIVINAAGCGSTLKEYGHLLQDDPQWAERAGIFSRKVRDLTEWLGPALGEPGFAPAAALPAGTTVTYHDACHLAHAQRITREPRALIRAIAGTSFIELPESDVCCGSAGSYNFTEPEMAGRLQRRKVEHVLKTGARIVVTTNPGCLLQIRAGLRQAGADDIEVLHLADFLDRVLRSSRPDQRETSDWASTRNW